MAEGVSRLGCSCMCMRMNVSRTMNPGFWRDWSFVRELHYAHGYRTGLFGKVLNDMADYGCDGKSATDGVDRMFAMCKAQYVNQSWIDKGAPDSPASGLRRTGDSPSEYTTSLVGNATLKFIQSVLAEDGARRPFFAWIGVHAPVRPAKTAR